jgi:hypothetical protein
MKSKRAKEYVKTIKLNKANVDYCLEHGRVNGFLLIDIEKAVDLAEQDAEGEITRYCTELEESKKREELACKVIDDQRKEMEKLKARAVEAFCQQCGWYEVDGNCSINDNKCPIGCEYANPFIQKLDEK